MVIILIDYNSNQSNCSHKLSGPALAHIKVLKDTYQIPNTSFKPRPPSLI
jgi:hypothetical protein